MKRQIAADQVRVSELEQKNINLQKELTNYVFAGQAEWVAFKTKFNYRYG